MAVLCAFAGLASGCTSGGSGAAPESANVATYQEQPEPKKNDLPKTIHLGGGGTATRLGPEPKRQRLWDVHWKEARVNFEDKNSFSGAMQGVTGTVYQNDTAMSTYSADRGMADKSQDILALDGNVEVVSPKYHATLKCRHLEWRPHEMLVHATGDVRIEMQNGTLNAGNDIFATPDLKEIATPGMFKR